MLRLTLSLEEMGDMDRDGSVAAIVPIEAGPLAVGDRVIVGFHAGPPDAGLVITTPDAPLARVVGLEAIRADGEMVYRVVLEGAGR